MKTFGMSTTAAVLTHCKCELMQAIWSFLLDSEFLDAYENGVSQSEGLGRTNNHNQHNKGLRKGKWWCASTVPERFCYGEGDASTPKG